MKPTLESMLKELAHSDFTDELIIYRLKDTIENCFAHLDYITEIEEADYLFTEYQENIRVIRACIVLLQWFTVDEYKDIIIKVNKYSLKLEELF